MKRSWVLLGVVAAGLLLAPLFVPIFAPWSEINCEHQDININTGQARFSRSLWFVTISERIEDTPISIALQGKSIEVADIAAWHRVNTFGPWTHYSPHYAFHRALYQAQELDMLSSLLRLTPEQKQEMAQSILIAWQQSGDDSDARQLIQQAMEEAIASQALRARQ